MRVLLAALILTPRRLGLCLRLQGNVLHIDMNV